MEKDAIFETAERYVRYTGRSIFLTGKAGTGKTTFLKYITQSISKRYVILAPTGVAAINAGGTTIHSFFQLPPHIFLTSKNLSQSTRCRRDTGISRRKDLRS